MPQILLTHPIHGSKFALSDAEVEHDEMFGWARYTDDTPVEAAPVEVKRKRKNARQVTEPTIEQPNEIPNFLISVSDESEGN